ncbi:MAG TPA: bifunctional serine/threonine-protein kinase/formylglycine-generating enzyme family protein [Povalibacter sp.]|uniref:bifunctional serine/threonine-protein kinase/formylglycine-generating enzyme family protein n=1 Tax=Povalibacter sp. TaxID=1962978 RepID=UPI002C1DA20D|nr:bifunctional serine/threonine-protein kinase/formylglycine-generating enzyme family protein [Povalibacter sp.]HMN47142.1 bifunctional serine/threonine-protein kinase/formylglycine-generating enzyme family protein [Povalibacter sp.]
MSQFRPALESYVEGQTDLPALQSGLKADLTREPSLAPVLGALIETSYRSGRINGPVYLDLMEIVRATTPPATPAPAAADEAETRYRPADQIVAPAADEEATRFRTAAQVISDDAATKLAPQAPRDDEATKLAPHDAQPRSQPSTGANSSSGGWNDLQAASSQFRPLRPGDTIKERFVLEDVIGKGGMGVVFRVRDLRKEEAQDRHPYAALKVLGEDFKRHPESLKALQREARKAQNLAHPNIVTVYDFDRDGSNVYIVMELLEGQPLDRYIKDLDGKGLTVAKALPIVRGLCGALGYAHEHQVVHSDFKPANAFITKSGAIKVFDFGIARAAKRPDAEDDTSGKTLFDAGTLGALTPAYASCEMLEGGEPDPRDDIYALGCVVYELLTCQHPFERKTAVQARDAKLKPKPIRGLTSRQWRALRRSLAFDRDARSPSIAKFLEEISPEKRSPALWGGIAAAIVVIGATAALLVPDYLQRRRSEAIGALVRVGTPESIEQALPQIEALPPDARARLLLDENLRSALIGHFSSQINALTDADQQKYDYPQAEGLMAQLRTLFPDSQAVSEIGDRLTSRKNDEIKRQSDRLDEFLKKGWLVDAQNPESAAGVLRVIAQIDPKHPLLIDPRLPSAYAEQAQLALRKPDVALAQALTQAGLIVAPQDRTLKDLDDSVTRELETQRRDARMAEVRGQLAGELATAASLSAFDPLHDDLLLLQATTPNDAALGGARRQIQSLLDSDMQALSARQSYDDAQALLARYADIVQPQFVERKRAELQAARSNAGVADDAQATNALRASLNELLQKAAGDDAWDIQVHSQLARLAAYLPPTDANLAALQQQAAQIHVSAAATLRSQGRLSEAELSLQRAAAFAPSLPAITQEQQLLARVRAEQDARDREQKRLAELAALKQKLQDQATANEVNEAMATLRDLRSKLPADDAFLASAPKAIAAAYVRLAATAARGSRFDTAVSLIDRSLELDRSNAQVATLREQYAQQLAAASRTAPAPTPAKEEPPKQVAAQPTTATPTQTTAAIATPPAATQSAPGGGCSASLAGYGTRSRGVCFDAVGSGRGPDLVVVPAGAGVAKPFAISRFEISAGEFATFCKESGKCNAGGGQADLPATSIPVTDAQQYVAWLSNATGNTYRLPTDAEWTYVAGAPGGSTERDFNCVVELNGQKIRGFGLGNVRSGRPNGWGLYNLAGNAQEWVKTGDGWAARGGAFSDPISQCGPALVRPSSGAADAATGFRVVRDLR